MDIKLSPLHIFLIIFCFCVALSVSLIVAFCLTPSNTNLTPANRLSSNPTVFSLTTTIDRAPFIKPTLDSLLNSSFQTKVYLHVSFDYDFQINHPNFVLNRIQEDYGPLTKLYPLLSLIENKETIIFLCDDDEIYPEKYHEELYEKIISSPEKAFGYRGINLNGTEFIFESGDQTKNVFALETYTGVVYKRKFFDTDFNVPKKESNCYYTDDLVIGSYLEKKGIQKIQIPGIKIGSMQNKAGNSKYPLIPNNFVAAIKPLSDKNLNSRNLKCLNEIQNNKKGCSCSSS
jgi:hypothetical protein